MKKYFFKKSLIWILIITVIIPSAIGVFPSLLITLTNLAGLEIDAVKIAGIYTMVTSTIGVFLYIYSGKLFANYLKKNSEYQGDFNKYQYIYYPLLIASIFLISTAADFFDRIIYASDFDKIAPNGIIGDAFAKSMLTLVLSLIVGIVSIVISSKCVSSLLCSVAEGEEAEKNYFSKVFLPLTVSLLIAVVLEIISVIFFELSVLPLVREIAQAVLLLSMLAGLKYKFDDEKTKKLVCNILPFVYVSISVVFAAIGIIRII